MAVDVQFQMVSRARQHPNHTGGRGGTWHLWRRGSSTTGGAADCLLDRASCRAGKGWLLCWSRHHRLSTRSFYEKKKGRGRYFLIFFFFGLAGSRKAPTSPASDSPHWIPESRSGAVATAQAGGSWLGMLPSPLSTLARGRAGVWGLQTGPGRIHTLRGYIFRFKTHDTFVVTFLRWSSPFPVSAGRSPLTSAHSKCKRALCSCTLLPLLTPWLIAKEGG